MASINQVGVKTNNTYTYYTLTPASHASSATTYGAGTSSNYGHVKLSDSYTSSGGAASSGVAASSYAVYQAYSNLKSKSLSSFHRTIGSAKYLEIVLPISHVYGPYTAYPNTKVYLPYYPIIISIISSGGAGDLNRSIMHRIEASGDIKAGYVHYTSSASTTSLTIKINWGSQGPAQEVFIICDSSAQVNIGA